MKQTKHEFFRKLFNRPKRYYNCIWELGDCIALEHIETLMRFQCLNDEDAGIKPQNQLRRLLNDLYFYFNRNEMHYDFGSREFFDYCKAIAEEEGIIVEMRCDEFANLLSRLISELTDENGTPHLAIHDEDFANFMNKLNEGAGKICRKINKGEIKKPLFLITENEIVKEAESIISKME